MSHWYTRDGELKQYIENKSKPGTLRPVTLRDARKEGWFPSTTTKLQILNKFLLNEYIKKEVIKLTIRECTEYVGVLSDEDILKNVLQKSEEMVSWSANFGTRVHKSVSSLFGGEPYEEPELDELDLVLADNVVSIPTPAMMAEFGDFTKVKAVAEATKEWMDANGFVLRTTEYTFVNPTLGGAGTVDWIGWHYDKPCVVDLKTQDAESTKDFHPWEEHPLQLADYVANLCSLCFFDDMVEEAGVIDTETNRFNLPHWEKEEIERLTVMTSRTHPGVVMPYQWSDTNDFKRMELINEYWFLDKKYDPRNFTKDVEQGSLLDA